MVETHWQQNVFTFFCFNLVPFSFFPSSSSVLNLSNFVFCSFCFIYFLLLSHSCQFSDSLFLSCPHSSLMSFLMFSSTAPCPFQPLTSLFYFHLICLLFFSQMFLCFLLLFSQVSTKVVRKAPLVLTVFRYSFSYTFLLIFSALIIYSYPSDPMLLILQRYPNIHSYTSLRCEDTGQSDWCLAVSVSDHVQDCESHCRCPPSSCWAEQLNKLIVGLCRVQVRLFFFTSDPRPSTPQSPLWTLFTGNVNETAVHYQLLLCPFVSPFSTPLKKPISDNTSRLDSLFRVGIVEHNIRKHCELTISGNGAV